METQAEIEFQSAVSAFSAAHNEPDWLRKLRLTMLAKYPELALPKFEKIKYQRWPLTAVHEPTIVDSSAADLSALSLDYADAKNVLVTVGETVLTTILDPALAAKGVIFTDLFTAVHEHPDLVAKYFMTTAVKPDDNRLTAFNAAFLNGGAFLYVPKGVKIEDPIQGYYIQDSTRTQDFIHHVLVVADTNSQVTYSENYATVGEQANLANIIVEVVAADDAHVRFSAVDQLSAATTGYISRRGNLANDAKLDWAIGMMNDGNVVVDFNTDLVGHGAHAEVKVVAVTTGEQLQGIDTRVTNLGQHTIGHILQHGVILESSALIFNGVGHIVKGARGSDAQQESRVLMLSTHARGDANPILLIDENDVTAGHAASVGRVDEEQMYYLMSRGIDKKRAERLVIRGFLGNVLTEIPAKRVRDQLTATIERKLENGQKSE